MSSPIITTVSSPPALSQGPSSQLPDVPPGDIDNTAPLSPSPPLPENLDSGFLDRGLVDNPLVMAEETNDGGDGDENDADELSSETLSPLPTTPPTPPTPPTTTNHVTECATIYSVLMACITTGYAAIYAYFASSSNSRGLEKLHDFWIWIMLPISVSAMGISFALKPRREDRPYKVFLYVQYFILTYFAEFLGLFWTPPNTSIIVEKSIECLVVYPALFMLGMKSR